MKNIADIQPGGFLVDNKYHNEIASIITQRDNLIYGLTGNKCIISGVIEESENIFSEGYTTFNGKVYRFLGGQKNTNVTIQRIEYERPNASQILAPAFYEDVMVFGNDGLETFPFSELKRVDSLSNLILAKADEVQNDELQKAVKLVDLLLRIPSTEKRGLIRLATTQEILQGEKTDIGISPKGLVDFVLRNATTSVRAMLRFATDIELEERQREDVAISPKNIDSFDPILMTGEVASNGVRKSFFKKEFSSSRLSIGKYRITHDLGTTSYGFTGAGTNTNVYVSMQVRNSNYCELFVGDDNTSNDGDFSFMIFKI